MSEAKPRQLGRWVVEERLGAGAYGAVFSAHHADQPTMRRAVKVLTSRDETAIARFRQEWELLARVRHPGIVVIHEVGRAGADVFFVMELVEGRSLRSVLDRTQGAGLPLERALKLVAKVARAVGAAHAQGICHRDLKPENVLVTPEGEPRVVDFGLATAADVERLTTTGAFVGTYGYMAPEQIEGKRAEQGPASDVYSLGAILHEVATGSPLYTGSPGEMLAGALLGEHPRASQLRPELPRELDALLARALAGSAAARFPDANAFALALEELEARRAGGLLAGGRRPLLVAARLVVVAAAVAAAVLASRARSTDPGSATSRPSPGPRASPSPARPTLPAWFLAFPPAERPDPIPPQLRVGVAPGEYVNEKDGSILVFVPATKARAGSEGDEAVFEEDERPAHDVVLSPYFVGKYELSASQFARFITDSPYTTLAEQLRRDAVDGPHILGANGTESTPTSARERLPIPGASWRVPFADAKPCHGDRPVVQIAWIDAVAYASWAGLRLPTEAEWEIAARWDRKTGRARLYPWGDDPGDRPRGNFISALEEAPSELAPVDAFPQSASPVGALNMAGNAREWVLDNPEDFNLDKRFYPRFAKGEVPALDPCNLWSEWQPAADHVARGGSLRDVAGYVRAAYRSSGRGSDDVTGFRVALSLDGSPRPRELAPWSPPR